MSPLEAFAAVLLVLGSFLVIKAVMAADSAGSVRKGEGSTQPSGEEPSRERPAA